MSWIKKENEGKKKNQNLMCFAVGGKVTVCEKGQGKRGEGKLMCKCIILSYATKITNWINACHTHQGKIASEG